MKNLCKGKHFFITGVSSGIGREMTRLIVKQGGKVFGLARRENELSRLKEELNPFTGDFEYLIGDLSHDGVVVKAVSMAQERFGLIEYLVPNAGYSLEKDFFECNYEDYEHLRKVHLDSVVEMIHLAKNDLEQTKGGILFINSFLGKFVLPGLSMNSLCKFGISSLAASLYYEFKSRGIQVTEVVLGVVKSDIRNRDEKGNYTLEKQREGYPFLEIETEKAASKMLNAVLKGKRRTTVGFHAMVLVNLFRYFGFLGHILIKIKNVKS